MPEERPLTVDDVYREDQLPNVTLLYEALFTADPLLLDERHQLIFGRQILTNLLLLRSLAATDPMDISLGEPLSRALFKNTPLPTTASIDERLKSAYFDAKKHRTTLNRNDFLDLKRITMVPRAEFTSDRLKSDLAGHDAARADLTPPDSADAGSRLDTRLRIAAIGYRVSVSRIPNAGLLDEELCPRPIAHADIHLADMPEEKSVDKLRRTKLRPQANQQRWLDTITRHIKLALERRSHFVVLPEFALPPDVPQTQTVESKIREIADTYTHEFFLFSGSRHEGEYNRGFILSREAKKTITDTWWHYKAASARGLGENIMGPQTAKLPGYNFTLISPEDGKPISYRMFVAMCYDVFDPTTFVNYVVQCAHADSDMYEKIILVPSFNPAKEFVDALRDLSFIASCPVIYVNGLHGDAKLFLYGIAIADLAAIESAAPKSAGAPQSASRFDQTLRDMITRLKTDIEETITQFRATVSAYKGATDPAIRLQLYNLSRQHYKRKDILDQRRKVLEHFCNDLDDLRQDGALRHLITTETCDRCTGRSHEDGDYCPNDMLYYNIDIRLFRLLSKFREDYFETDDFLPRPFRFEEKDKIFAKIREKKELRAMENSQR
jgi:hypothetical protein